MNSKTIRYILITSVVFFSFALDQISKTWARINIQSREFYTNPESCLQTEISKVINPHFSKLSETPYPQETPIISDYFVLMNVENFGAFLGFGSCLSNNLRLILLIILPVIVLISITVYTFIEKSLDKISIFGFSLIIGGGLANIFDRIIYGSVTDFLYINLGGPLRTGIFNIADLFVTTGMILILISSFKKKSKIL